MLFYVNFTALILFFMKVPCEFLSVECFNDVHSWCVLKARCFRKDIPVFNGKNKQTKNNINELAELNSTTSRAK